MTSHVTVLSFIYYVNLSFVFTASHTQPCCHIFVLEVAKEIEEGLISQEYYFEDRINCEKNIKGGKIGDKMSQDVNRISWTVSEKPRRKFALVYRHIQRNEKRCSGQRKLKLKISVRRKDKSYDN